VLWEREFEESWRWKERGNEEAVKPFLVPLERSGKATWVERRPREGTELCVML
jgi:hypothetical protein